MTSTPDSSTLARVLLLPALAFGQIVGWGATYYLPSVLGSAFAGDLGFGSTEIYLGVTIMVAIGGLTSPIAGRSFDRFGAARFLPIAPLAIGLGLLLFAALPRAATWYVAWALFGLAMGFGLTLGVNTFLTRVVGHAARARIGILALMVGFAPTLFWPLTAALEVRFGWRATVALYGLVELVVVLPLQVWIAARWPDRTMAVETDGAALAAEEAPPALSPRVRMTAIIAMGVAFTAQGFASWGLPLHIISLFEDFGLDHSAAVRVAAASGAAAIAARTIEVVVGQRIHPITTTGLCIAVLAPMLALLGSPLDPATSAWVFILVWSGANGILAVLRVTLPLHLFGAAAYGTLMGKMSLPQNLVFAASPTAFAKAIEWGGPKAALGLAIGASLAALVAAAVLARIARQPERAARTAGAEQEGRAASAGVPRTAM